MKKALPPLIIFLILSVIAYFIPYFKLDLVITQTFQSIHYQLFTHLMWFISTIGNQPVMVVIVAITGLLLYLFKLRVEAVVCTLSTAGSALIGTIVKIFVNRPRPSPSLVHVSLHLSDKSFPSGHVLVFTVFFGYLFYLLFNKPKRQKKINLLLILFSFLIVAIGISRIYLGAHWASDVLGGYLLGLFCLIISIRLYNSYHGKR
jgi:undecaprenyl-diphosphatase